MPSPSSVPPSILPTSALGVGLDALVAASAARHAGIADLRATFEYSMSFPSEHHAFMVLAGLEPLLDALERFKLKADELSWLESSGVIDADARRRLGEGRFSCDVDAAPEGSVVFADEPLLTVEGPFWQAQLVSALVESALGEATLVATKIARAVIAAEGAAIIETSAASSRRLGGAPLLARAAFVAGAHATSSALAGKRYGLPVRAIEPARFTAAGAPFEAWLSAAKDAAIVRLDGRPSRDAIADLVRAVRGRAYQGDAWGDAQVGVLVSAATAVERASDVRRAFEEAGLREPAIVVEGAHDESVVSELRRQSVPFAAFAVSTHVPFDAASLARYALVALEAQGEWSPRRSAGTDPGRKVILRYVDADGAAIADVIHLANERHLRVKDGRYIDRASLASVPLRGASSCAPLLANVMRQGRRVASPESPLAIRARAERSIASIAPSHRRLAMPARYPVGITSGVLALRAELLSPS
jgi:nicotinate phosphoribosyltransferase